MLPTICTEVLKLIYSVVFTHNSAIFANEYGAVTVSASVAGMVEW